MELMNRQPDLLKVILALTSASRRASVLHSREQDRDQNSNNGNDHQKFDQCKSCSNNRRVAVVMDDSLTGVHGGRVLSGNAGENAN
jgi:hypothetical protein